MSRKYKTFESVRVKILEFCHTSRRSFVVARECNLGHTTTLIHLTKLMSAKLVERTETRTSSFKNAKITITFKTTNKGKKFMEFMK